MTRFRIEALGKHDRQAFQSDSPDLNRYLKTQVSQDVRRRVTACFVAVDVGSDDLAGFYTLSAGGLSIRDLPESLARKLPRYPSVPIVRVGRLAVSSEQLGRGVGRMMLIDAIRRTIESDIAAFAVVVDAKDDNAVQFYRHHGFIQFAGNKHSLFLPVNAAVKELLDGT
ncbi:Acetyltransferase (GNAT) family protein [Crateriforma conspicua]|uniref:Acetyltransferase (GNAT) family protein n=1 Tax=Crateriforma conspicua TaxID=2527996 RepID=A0A5C6FQG6_9PLAN|nr:GNAT family N-acetyltransferase [Crateriforma conspicua]TWU62341.1 Acetyltransferase (GNAT) family protein [Crateriforma conspicua]